ncbi:MAG: AAA family ATPase [Treponemataceae bacterium]
MAVITISRQVAALGDETAEYLAKKMQYEFIDRKKLGEKILSLGFSAEKMKRYDEKKPGFFASLAKERDEYLDYLQTAILEFANQGNCILIGRGSFIVLQGVPNVISVRLVAEEKIRIERLQSEFSWSEKQAKQRVDESDTNRCGFHQSFFNLSNEEPEHFHMTLNMGILNNAQAGDMIENLLKLYICDDYEQKGKLRLHELLQAQKLINTLILDYKLPINFMRAEIQGKILTLHGVADSSLIVEKAIALSKEIIKDKTIESTISIVQEFRSFTK